MERRGDDWVLDEKIQHAEDRVRILTALAEGIGDPHAVLDLVMAADGPEAARLALEQRFGWDETQAAAVLEVQFRKAAAGEHARIVDELDTAREQLDHLRSLGS